MVAFAIPVAFTVTYYFLRLKKKILIKNKRLKPEVEKTELDLFWKGEFSIGKTGNLLQFFLVYIFLYEKYDTNNIDIPSDENEEPKEDAEGGKELLKKEDPEAGTVGE